MPRYKKMKAKRLGHRNHLNRWKRWIVTQVSKSADWVERVHPHIPRRGCLKYLDWVQVGVVESRKTIGRRASNHFDSQAKQVLLKWSGKTSNIAINFKVSNLVRLATQRFCCTFPMLVPIGNGRVAIGYPGCSKLQGQSQRFLQTPAVCASYRFPNN